VSRDSVASPDVISAELERLGWGKGVPQTRSLTFLRWCRGTAPHAVHDDGHDEDQQGQHGGCEIEVVAGEEAVEHIASGGKGG
jgi:hypothetical protein